MTYNVFGGTLSLTQSINHQLHSVEGRAKCPTVPHCRELVTGTSAAGKRVNK